MEPGKNYLLQNNYENDSKCRKHQLKDSSNGSPYLNHERRHTEDHCINSTSYTTGT